MMPPLTAVCKHLLGKMSRPPMRTMTDHIFFDGNPRLTGQTLRVHVVEATAFTLPLH